MTHANQTPAVVSQDLSLEAGWQWRTVGPLVIAAMVVIALAILIVFSSRSAWDLLGIGRGLVTPNYYHYTALLIVLGTAFGQFAGWAVGSVLLTYVWHLLTGRAINLHIVQAAMSIVYCGLAVVPLFFYHILYGQPLAGMPRPGIAAWLHQHYPDASWLLISGHHVIDLLMIPLLIAVLALIWGSGERLVRHRGVQTLVLLLILTTSFVVAMSLAIHSTLAHLRLGP
jgi:hypothetical protein